MDKTQMTNILIKKQIPPYLFATLEIHGNRIISKAEMLRLYSIAHEAMRNVGKHSQVCDATVRLGLNAEDSYLDITERGVGVNPQAISSQQCQLGLVGMSERRAKSDGICFSRRNPIRECAFCSG